MFGATDTGLGIGLVIFFIVWISIVVGSIVMTIVALVDIVRRPDWEWKLARQEKILWLLLVILINFLAIPSLIYWFNVRKKLIAVRDAAARGQFGPGHMTYSGWEPNPAPAPYADWAPAGWYPDAGRIGQFRWWDGAQWTDHVWSQGPTG